MADRIELCPKDDVPDGGVILVETDDLELAVYQVSGEFFVTDNACTHGPGELSEGELDGYEIECDFHQGRFDIRDGSVAAPPCMVPVKTYKVVPDETKVVIET